MTPRADGDIHRRVTVAMILYTLSVVVILGGISFLLITHLIRGNVRQAIESEAAQRSQKLEHALASIQEDLKSLSANSIIINAIIDTGGSRIYVDPFFNSYRGKGDIPSLLTLCDYAGKPIASNAGRPVPYNRPALLRQTIGNALPYAEISRREGGDNATSLLLAYPVVWAMTGKPEGLLVVEIAVDDIVNNAFPAAGGNSDFSLVLQSRGSVLVSRNRAKPGSLIRIVKPLALDEPLRSLSLRLEINDFREIRTGWLAPTYAIAAICLMVIAVFPARRISSALTSHLRSLSGTVQEIAESGSLEVKAEIAGPDEVRVLATSFNAMIDRLRKSQEHLEARVAERTAELTASNVELSKSNTEKEVLIRELQEALASIKTLRGLLPICSSCKKVRDDSGYWNQIDSYLSEHSELDFSHGICPDCSEKLYGKRF